jgi:hypothetical protein
MSTTKKKTIRKTEVEIENKKPPVLEDLPQPVENQEITTQRERALYEGQEHIEDISQDQLNQSNQSNQLVTEIKNENSKKEIITKPRETYLKEKISKLNCNKNLMSNIKKELNDQIKTMVEEDNVLITEVPKDLNKYIKKQNDIKNIKISNADFSSKQKYKQLKALKDEQNILKTNLKQVEESEKLLQNEGFINLNSNKRYEGDTKFDKAMHELKLKEIQQKKEKIIEKIKNIEIKIFNIVQEDQPLTNQEKKKIFINNFERDKEIAETRAKKYLKESKERDQRMKNDINQLMEKRKKEIEEKDNQEKKRKEEYIKHLKEKERAIELKHSKQNIEIMEKYKEFRTKKLEKKGKDYRYSKIYEKFKKNEEKVFKEANEKRRKLFDSANIEGIKEFTKKVDEKKEKDEMEREQKRMEMLKNWNQNKNNLPKCNYVITNVEENSKKEEDEKKKKDQIKVLISEKNKYGNNIKMPEIDEKLKDKREKQILALEEPLNHKKYTLNKQKKNRIILKKRNNSKPSKFKRELKLEDPSIDKIEEANKNLIKKPKRINLSPIIRTKSLIPDKKPNYLREMMNKKEEKNRSMSTKSREGEDEDLYINQKSKKWEKAINNNNGSLMENIHNIKEKANILEKNAEMKEKLLKLNGGIESNPELGKKVSNLLIDSIEAKLSILKKISKV